MAMKIKKQLELLEDNNFTVYQGIYSKRINIVSLTSRILELKK